MPNLQEKLDELNKVLANKTPSTGCRLLRRKYWEVDGVKGAEPREGIIGQRYENQDRIAYGIFWSDTGTYACTEFENSIFNKKLDDGEYEYVIIGHPVMLGDVLDWIEKRIVNTWVSGRNKLFLEVFHNRNDKRKSIDEQSIECIEFIYSLIKGEGGD